MAVSKGQAIERDTSLGFDERELESHASCWCPVDVHFQQARESVSS